MSRSGKGKVFFLLVSLLVALFLASYLAGRMGLLKREGLPLSSKKIGVVYVQGILQESRGIIQELEKYKDRDDVKAVVFRIESPGGAVGTAQEIYEEVRKLSEKKTVLASLGNVAASGGYYVAAAAEEIVANPGTLTGSIGVISEYPNYQELMQKIGYRAEILKSGRYKDLGNPMREMNPEEITMVKQILENVHDQFIRDVARGRKKDVEEIRPLADGRLFTGEQAKDVGLVDRLGNLQDALDRAADLAGIEGKPLVLYPEDKKHRIWEFLFQGLQNLIKSGLQGALEQARPISIHL